LLPQLQVEAASQARWFEDQPIGKTARELWDRGYAFDYVSDRQLQTAKVKNGEIQMPGGDYKVIVVPECKFIPLETFKQLLALAENGATIFFENDLPKDVSGANDLKKRQAEFKDQLSKIHFTTITDFGLAKANIGKGNILRAMSWMPWESFTRAVRESMVDTGLSFVRRSFNGGWHYFIANHSTTNFDGWITLGREAKSVDILDPMTGNSGAAATRQSAANSTEIHLQLAAGESVIVRALNNGFAADRILIGWNYWQTNGQPVEISGNWNVKFISGGPSMPADSQTTELVSWTTFADTNTQAFAGTAEYGIIFDAPGSTGKNYFLNLGDVRQSARVKLNGKDYGTLITPPFRVVVNNLKSTGNKLEVEVTSVAANRIRDLDRRGVKWKTFRDINFVDINYKPFDAANWPLTDCGLLGPVTLTPIKPMTN
jgi:hypothetical protein